MTAGRISSALLRSSLFYRRPIHALVPTCSLHHFTAGQTIFEPGEVTTHLVVLVVGEADTYAVRVNGDLHPVAFHRAPDALIEPGIFASDRRRRIGAVATVDTETVHVPRDALIRAGAADPVLAERLLTAIADASAPPPPVGPSTLEDRVLTCLRSLAETFGVHQPDGSVLIGLRVTLAELGPLVGATGTEVGRAVKALEAADEIERLGDHFLLNKAG